MKNGLLIWNVVLTLLVGFLLVKQFGSGKSKKVDPTNTSTDSLNTNKQFRIAYFEMDSIASNFDLVKQLKTELTNREDAINKEMSNRSKAIQEKYNYYQNQAQKGSLSQTQSEVAEREIREMDEEMKNRRQQLDQEYNNYMMTKQNDIKSKIEDFLKEYNKTKDFSYIVSYEQGLFYFKDTAYNITADVVSGLNEKYKPVKK